MELNNNVLPVCVAAIMATTVFTLPAQAAIDLSAGEDIVTDLLAFFTGTFAIAVGALALAWAAYKGFFARDREIPIWPMALVLISFIVVRNAESIMTSLGGA